jgi:hypothetical protein
MRKMVVSRHYCVLAAVVLAPLFWAHADNYTWDFNSASDPRNVHSLPGSHHFQVDNVPANYSTQWQVSVWGDFCEVWGYYPIYNETDLGNDPTVTPELTRSFYAGKFMISARIRSASNEIAKDIIWLLKVEVPDLTLSYPSTNPKPVQLKAPFTVKTKIRNQAKHFIASAGPDADQEVHFFLDDKFAGSVSYDDVLPDPENEIEIESPPMIVNKAGTHKIVAVCDATNTVDEIEDYAEANNDVERLFVVSAIVPDIVGMPLREARKTLRDAGVELGDITETADNSIPRNQVVDQNPDAGAEIGNDPTVDVTINVKPCKINVLQPAENAEWQIGSTQTITWDRFEACLEKVRIELWQNDQFVATIDNRTKNDETFEWLIDANDVTPGDGYFIRIYLGKKYSDSQGTFSLVAP